MGKNVKNFAEYYNLNEAKLKIKPYDKVKVGDAAFESAKIDESKKFKDFIDVARAAEIAYGDGDMEITPTSKGFTYLDVDDNKIEVIIKGNKASIVDGEQNMTIDDFVNLISNDDPESLYECIDEITEGKKAKISKALVQATDKYHEAQLKLQKLQKEFVETPKENVVEREKLKKSIIDAHKEVQQTEKEFQATLGAEDVDDIEIIW